jgi:hypothetical protein
MYQASLCALSGEAGAVTVRRWPSPRDTYSARPVWSGFAVGSGLDWGLKFGANFLAITSSACAILESSPRSLFTLRFVMAVREIIISHRARESNGVTGAGRNEKGRDSLIGSVGGNRPKAAVAPPDNLSSSLSVWLGPA